MKKRAKYIGASGSTIYPKTGTAPKRMTRKQLVKALDVACSLYIRKRDKRCVTCGSKKKPQCGHYISRRKMRLRWDKRNCNRQCGPCNNFHNYFPYRYERYMRHHYGNEVLDELNRLADLPKWKWTISELEAMLKDFQAALSPLSQRPPRTG